MPARAFAFVGVALLVSGCAPAQPGPAATTIVSSKPTTAAVASPSASVAIAVAKPVVSPVASPGVAASPSPVALATPRPAPQPLTAGTFGFGRPATPDEVKKIDIALDGRFQFRLGMLEYRRRRRVLRPPPVAPGSW